LISHEQKLLDELHKIFPNMIFVWDNNPLAIDGFSSRYLFMTLRANPGKIVQLKLGNSLERTTVESLAKLVLHHVEPQLKE